MLSVAITGFIQKQLLDSKAIKSEFCYWNCTLIETAFVKAQVLNLPVLCWKLDSGLWSHDTLIFGYWASFIFVKEMLCMSAYQKMGTAALRRSARVVMHCMDCWCLWVKSVPLTKLLTLFDYLGKRILQTIEVFLKINQPKVGAEIILPGDFSLA